MHPQKRNQILRRKWTRSTATMVGGMVGVGIFGLPYTFAQAGFFVGFVALMLVGGLVLLFQLLYGEITIQTKGTMRIFGLVKEYKGTGWSSLAMVSLFGSLWGAMVAFIIIGGEFLFHLFGGSFGGNPFIYSLIYSGIASVFLLMKLHKLTGFESIVVACFLFLFVVIIIVGIPHVHVSNLLGVQFDSVIPVYGVVLFAIGGFGIAPEMHALLGERFERYLPTSMMSAYAIVGVLYLLFSLVVVGAVGSAVGPDAISSLQSTLGSGVALLTTIIGSITVFSIFLVVGLQIKETLASDLRFSPVFAWALTIGVPIVVFLLGVREFISVIGFTGAVFGSLTVIILLLTYLRMKQTVCRTTHCFAIPGWAVWMLILFFAFGGVSNVVHAFM